MDNNGSKFQVKVTKKQQDAMVKAMKFPDPPAQKAAQKVTTPVFGAAPQGAPSSNPLARIAASNAQEYGPLVRIARAENKAYSGKGGKRKTRKSKKSRKSTKRRSKH